MARYIIRGLAPVAADIGSTRRTADRLNIVFVPNYDVSSAELLFPATEISEQISTAGTEASGTGCMKAVMNGGVIVGTLDGANIEIRDAVGLENIFTFGQTADGIAKLQAERYDPRRIVESNAELQRVIERIASLGQEG